MPTAIVTVAFRLIDDTRLYAIRSDAPMDTCAIHDLLEYFAAQGLLLEPEIEAKTHVWELP